MKRVKNSEKIEQLLGPKELDTTKDYKREKGDTAAILIAAFTTFFPAVFIFLAIFALMIWLVLEVNILSLGIIFAVLGVALLIVGKVLQKNE